MSADEVVLLSGHSRWCTLRELRTQALFENVSAPSFHFSLNLVQVVYAMVPRPPCSKRVLQMIKIMTFGRSVDVISGNFSWNFWS